MPRVFPRGDVAVGARKPVSTLQGPQPGPGPPCAPSTRLLLSGRMAPRAARLGQLSASTAGLWSLRASSIGPFPGSCGS